MKILGWLLILVCVGMAAYAEDTSNLSLANVAKNVSPDLTRPMTTDNSDRAILLFCSVIFPLPEQSVSIEGKRLVISDNGSYITANDPLSTATLLASHLDDARKVVEAYPNRFEIVEIRWFTPKKPKGDLMGVLAVQVNKIRGTPLGSTGTPDAYGGNAPNYDTWYK